MLEDIRKRKIRQLLYDIFHIFENVEMLKDYAKDIAQKQDLDLKPSDMYKMFHVLRVVQQDVEMAKKRFNQIDYLRIYVDDVDEDDDDFDDEYE